MAGSKFGITAAELSDLFAERETAGLKARGGIEGIAAAVQSDLDNGLSQEQLSGPKLQARLAAFGSNKTQPPPSKSLFDLMIEALEDGTLRILIVAAVVSLVLGFYENPSSGWIEGAAILMAVVIVVLVTSLNNYSKEKQFRKLSEVADDKLIKVMRGGSQIQVSVFDIVVGDIVELFTGDEIPADGLVISHHNLKVDESTMTGEPDAIKKNEANPFLISGCSVVEGVGRMLVIAVGTHSEKGKIKALLVKEQEVTLRVCLVNF